MTKKKPNYRPRTKGNFKKDKDTEVSSKVAKEKYNDPSWYVKEGQLAKDVASLSFNNALGAPVRFENELTYISQSQSPAFVASLPGILTINCVPAMGYSGSGSSPINIAAKNIYGYVRHQNSGHANYDAPDLMLYLGAMDSVYSFIATLMRVYGTARTFSQVNRYVGDSLIAAQGFNPNEIRQNLANFRAYINMFITKASAFCTPNIMSLYKRHFWMMSGIYKDQEVAKSQMYMYRPVALWKYDELDGAGYLKAVPFISTFTESSGIGITQWNLSTVYQFGNDLLGALNNSEDINIMSGDILKAYGQGNLWSLALINEDYVVLPVYSNEVLDQIHNTTFVGNKPTSGINQTTTTDPVLTMDGLNVTQNTSPTEDGRIIFTPQFVGNATPSWTRLVDLPYDSPTPEDVLVATRNMVMGSVMSQTTKYTVQVETCGSDLALFASVWQMNNSGIAYATSFFGSDTAPALGVLRTLDKFQRAPILYQLDSATGGGSIPGDMVGVWGQIDNYTLVGFDDLKRMHESAILAMLGVPFYGVASQG